MAEGSDLGNKILEAVRNGRAVRPARLAGARGALPIPPSQLVALQLLLVEDDDPEIRTAAAHSLASLAADAAQALVDDPETPLDVLAFLAEEPVRWPAAATKLASMSKLAPSALRPIAGSDIPEALAALVLNNVALSADDELGRLLADNPALPETSRGRLLDYLDELAKRERPAADADAAGEPELDLDDPAFRVGPPARDPFLAALGIDAEVEALLPELGLDFGLLSERSELLGEPADEAEARLAARLQKMNMGQKLKVALFGGREARLILIRDSNRLVSAGVVKNPKFTEQEAEAAANSRNVSSDVLRLVSRHREYGKIYMVQHALVRNPRCPPEVALPLVGALNDRDLRLLMKNRNISEAVRRQVKRTIDTREERKKVRLGPGKH